MNKLEELIEQIKNLEQELLQELQQKQDEYFYIIKGKRVRFEEETQRYHRTLVTNTRTYLAEASILNILTFPFIWSCLVAALFMDLVVSIYHSSCFRIYGIPGVKRGNYIVIDHHSLAYLNWIEKLNCIYCSYFNGLIGWIQEIGARSEQYWCPIKHARKLSSIHGRYHRFIPYGDSKDFQQRFEQTRRDFDDLNHKT